MVYLTQGLHGSIKGHNSDRYSEYHLAVPWPDAVVTSLNSRWAPAEFAYAMRDSRVHAFVVLTPGAEVTAEELRAHAKTASPATSVRTRSVSSQHRRRPRPARYPSGTCGSQAVAKESL